MSDNKEYGFSFDFDDDNSNDIFSSSKPAVDEFEDIASFSEQNDPSEIGFEIFSDTAAVPTRYKKKKRGIAGVCQRIDEWWHSRSAGERALMVTGIVLFSLLALFVIWAFIPFLEMRGKLFGSAFGLLLLNLFVYFCIHWKKRKLQTVLMGIISLFLAGLMVLTLFFWIPLLNKIYNFDHTFTNDAEELAAVPPIDKNITNIALFGIDTRDTNSFSGNSDSIMILSLNAREHTVKIISVMRDSLVPIERNGKTTYGKVNSAYGSGGAELAVRTLNSIFDLDITEYATVNFFGMSKIIDAVGGIDIELTESECTPPNGKYKGARLNECIFEICAITGLDPTKYYITKPGKHHVNGIQAVAYSRIRYVANIWGTSNDYGRTDRQRYVMEQLFNKALTMSKAEYPKLIKALIPFTVTSLSPDEILSFAYNIMKKSPTFHQARMPQDEYQMKAPSGSFGSVVYYDLDFAAELIHAFIYDNITFDEYTEANGITKNNWYHGGSGGSNSGSGGGSSTVTSSDEDEEPIESEPDDEIVDDELLDDENNSSDEEIPSDGDSSGDETSSNDSSSEDMSSSEGSESTPTDSSGDTSSVTSSSGTTSDTSSGGTSTGSDE